MIVIQPHSDTVNAVCYNPDGTLLSSVSEDGWVKVWNPATLHTERPVWEAEPDSDAEDVDYFFGSTGLQHAQFTPDGKLLITGGYMQYLQAWDAKTGRHRWQVIQPRDGVGILLVSADGRKVAFAAALIGDAERVSVLDMKSRKVERRLSGHNNACGALAAGPDGFASGGADACIHFWSWNDGRCYHSLALRGVVRGLKFSPDGTRLAASGGTTVTVWDMDPPPRGRGRRHPKRARHFRGHTGQVQFLDFSPDGATLASVAHDGTIRIWDVATGGEVRAFAPNVGKLRSVAFAPDGLTLAFSSQRGHVGILDVGG